MRLLRVLQNLVGPTRSMCVKGKPNGRIDLLRVGGRIRSCIYVVRDNGAGIPDAIKDRIFEPFVTHGKTGGTGLGLAIVQNVVTAHRGKISVETQKDVGTEFLIRLPQDSASPAVE